MFDQGHCTPHALSRRQKRLPTTTMTPRLLALALALAPAAMFAPSVALAHAKTHLHHRTRAAVRHHGRPTRSPRKRSQHRRVRATFSQLTAGPGVQAATISLPPVTYYTSPTGTASARTQSRARPMALATALSSAPADSVVHLASGSYPRIVDNLRRSDWVTLTGGGDRTRPVIDGANLLGSQYLRFVGLSFSSVVYISDNPWLKEQQPSRHIEILNSEINCHSTVATAGTTGIFVRAASQDIAVSGDLVHNCVVGLGSVAQDPVSTGISITHSTFQNLPGDAVDLGGLAGVVIDHNVIKGIADPAGIYHNDGIQFFGNVTNVQITNNVLSNSRDQLIFIQDAIRSTVTHSSVNSNILIAHNLIYGAGAYAVQSQGALDTRFVGNTMWSNHFGSLLLRKSSFSGLAPTDTVVIDNIIQGFGLDQVTPAVEDHNLITGTPVGYRGGPHNLRNVDPKFLGAQDGDFQLAASSPAQNADGATAAAADLLQNSAVSTDLYGLRGSPLGNIGAIQPGDPAIAYGAPVYGPAPLL